MIVKLCSIISLDDTRDARETREAVSLVSEQQSRVYCIN